MALFQFALDFWMLVPVDHATGTFPISPYFILSHLLTAVGKDIERARTEKGKRIFDVQLSPLGSKEMASEKKICSS